MKQTIFVLFLLIGSAAAAVLRQTPAAPAAAPSAAKEAEAKKPAEAKKAEETKKAAAAPAAAPSAAKEAKKPAEAKKAEETKKAAETKKAEDIKKAQETLKAELAKKAKETKKAEETKKAKETKKAEETKKPEETKKAEETTPQKGKETKKAAAAGPVAAPAAAPAAAPGAAPGAAAPVAPLSASLGSSKCPCVSIANIKGATKVRISKNVTTDYPADLGAYCSAWDNGRNPLFCKPGQKPGKDNGWCAQPWCYVDPCNCDLDVPAAESPEDGGYQPGTSYQGKGLWYSYKTCGGVDMWMDPELKKTQPKEPAVCSVKQDEKVWGNEKCKCIGIADQAGTTNISLGKGKTMAYPADIGASCEQWDFKRHPACLKQDPPKWCTQSWCYVDPCQCRIETPPKSAGDGGYLPKALGNGKTLHYSYATCGSVDMWAVGADKDETKECISLKTKTDCSKNKECAWGGEAAVCLKKSLVEICTADELALRGSASSLTVGAAFVLSIAAALMA